MRKTSKLLALLTVAVILPAPAWAIPDFRDTITTERLVGTWARFGPGGLGSGRVSATLRILDSFGSAPLYRLMIRCIGVSECPGRRASVRAITLVRRGPIGRDGLIYDVDADATFETGVICHFAGVTVSGYLYVLSSDFTCMTAGGLPDDYGQFWLLRRGLPTSRPINQ